MTVDGDAVNVAIIKPGNIYPADISTAVFKERLGNLLTFTPHFNIDSTEDVNSGNLEIEINNSLEKQVMVEIAFHDNAHWQISPHQLTFEVKPGQSTEGTVALRVPSDALIPFPVYDYAIIYGGEQLRSGSNLLHPIDSADMRVLKNWMLLGPFDLGVSEAPADPNDAPPNFRTALLPEFGENATYEGQAGEIVWQEHISETERINVDDVFANPNWAFGYGMTHVKSPDERRVFAQIGWGSNLGRLFLNGVEVPAASARGTHLYRGWAHFELPLKAGWNTIVIQTGDYTGRWDYRMEVADPTEALQFRVKGSDLQD